jgi:hypothetical protein
MANVRLRKSNYKDALPENVATSKNMASKILDGEHLVTICCAVNRKEFHLLIYCDERARVAVHLTVRFYEE